MSDRGGRFYTHDLGGDGHATECCNASAVGVELDSGQAVELCIPDGRIELYGHGAFALHPRSSNVVEVVPIGGSGRPSRIERGETSIRDGRTALARLRDLVSECRTTDTVSEMRACLEFIRRALR